MVRQRALTGPGNSGHVQVQPLVSASGESEIAIVFRFLGGKINY